MASQAKSDIRPVWWLGDILQHVTSIRGQIVSRKSRYCGCVAFRSCPLNQYQSIPTYILIFNQSVEGFQSCHPIITIDNTHLYSKYKGMMLVTLGLWSVVHTYIYYSRRRESWQWELAHGLHSSEDDARPDFHVISNRLRGIIATINDENLGWGPRRAHYCRRVGHLMSNFSVKYNDKSLKMLLVAVAYEW